MPNVAAFANRLEATFSFRWLKKNKTRASSEPYRRSQITSKDLRSRPRPPSEHRRAALPSMGQRQFFCLQFFCRFREATDGVDQWPDLSGLLRRRDRRGGEGKMPLSEIG